MSVVEEEEGRWRGSGDEGVSVVERKRRGRKEIRGLRSRCGRWREVEGDKGSVRNGGDALVERQMSGKR